MTFDSKKEYKEFYMPKNKPEIANIPKANHIAVRGFTFCKSLHANRSVNLYGK